MSILYWTDNLLLACPSSLQYKHPPLSSCKHPLHMQDPFKRRHFDPWSISTFPLWTKAIPASTEHTLESSKDWGLSPGFVHYQLWQHLASYSISPGPLYLNQEMEITAPSNGWEKITGGTEGCAWHIHTKGDFFRGWSVLDKYLFTTVPLKNINSLPNY